MTSISCVRSAALQSAAAVVALTMGLSAAAGTPKVTATTPQGITLVEVVSEGGTSQPVLQWVRPGDAQGRTLLASDKDVAGVSNCVADCAQEFTPLPVAQGAKAFGDWSLVRRQDGSRQWAYQSHPLYTWVREKTPGQVATSVSAAEKANSRGGGAAAAGGGRGGGPPALLPPAGWTVVRFTPAASVSLPDGIAVDLVAAAQAVALTDLNKMTLYTFDGDAKRDQQTCTASGCAIQWLPVAAPELAAGVGDFSIVTRSDGSTQWAYKRRPLYLYTGDKLPGDAHGMGVDKRWSVAALSTDFRPSQVAITPLVGYGDVVSVNGMTLYGGYPFEKRWGGRNLRDTFLHNAYDKGKSLGGAACADDCLHTWHPFLASADAQPSGFWEPITRSDGSRQWAYKGYALYTYAGDKAPGDHTGQAVYDFAKPEASESDFKKTAFIVNISRAPGGAGIYWSIAKP